jgi:hypothetical protein
MGVNILSSDHGLALGEAGPVCIAVWRGGVTRVRFQRQKVGLGDVVARHPGGAAFLCVVEATTNPPDEEQRRASIQLLTSFGSTLKCAALTIEAGGFRGALIRTVASAMAALRTSPRPPAAAFLGVTSAARWMGEHLPLGPAEELAAAVEVVRAVLPPLVDTF